MLVGLADCPHHTTTSNTSAASLLLTLPHPPSATYGPAPIAREYAPDCLDDDDDDNLHWVDCRTSSSSEWQALVFDQQDNLDHDDVHYQFRSTRTGLCLGFNHEDDDAVHPVPCDTSHMGTFWRVQNGRVLSQADPSLCWDTSSTLLQLTPCSSTTSTSSSTIVRALQQQQVFLGPTSIVRFDGTCLQATTSSDYLMEDDCNDTPEQQFRLGPTSTTTTSATSTSYLVQSVTTGACVVREDDENAVKTTGPCDASNANAVWTLTGGDVQNDATVSTTIANNNNNECLISPFTFRQSGILGLLFHILNWFLDLFRNLFERERRVQLGSCTDAAAQNTLSLGVQRDPWLGPIQTALVASAMANRPDGASILY